MLLNLNKKEKKKISAQHYLSIVNNNIKIEDNIRLECDRWASYLVNSLQNRPPYTLEYANRMIGHNLVFILFQIIIVSNKFKYKTSRVGNRTIRAMTPSKSLEFLVFQFSNWYQPIITDPKDDVDILDHDNYDLTFKEGKQKGLCSVVIKEAKGFGLEGSSLIEEEILSSNRLEYNKKILICLYRAFKKVFKENTEVEYMGDIYILD